MEKHSEKQFKKIIPFKATGEHPFHLFLGITTFLILEITLIMFAIVSEKLMGSFVAVVLALLGLFLFRRLIRWVYFGEKSISVKYFYGNERV